MNLNDILHEYPKYTELKQSQAPVSVSGVEEAARAQLIYSLFNEQNDHALVICYSDMEAHALEADLEFYTDEVLMFPSKEYIFYNIETSGHSNENTRLSVISQLVSDK